MGHVDLLLLPHHGSEARARVIQAPAGIGVDGHRGCRAPASGVWQRQVVLHGGVDVPYPPPALRHEALRHHHPAVLGGLGLHRLQEECPLKEAVKQRVVEADLAYQRLEVPLGDLPVLGDLEEEAENLLCLLLLHVPGPGHRVEGEPEDGAELLGAEGFVLLLRGRPHADVQGQPVIHLVGLGHLDQVPDEDVVVQLPQGQVPGQPRQVQGEGQDQLRHPVEDPGGAACPERQGGVH